MRINLIGLGSVLLVGTLVGACLAPSDDGSGQQDVVIALETYCAKTLCEQHRERCDEWTDDCFSKCSALSPSYRSQCTSICLEQDCSPCTEWDNQCAEQGEHWVVHGPVNERVQGACEAAAASLAQCQPYRLADCAVFSRVYGDQAVPFFDCFAREACNDVNVCWAPPRTQLGTEIGAALNTACGEASEWTASREEGYNSNTGYFNASVMAIASNCLAERDCTRMAQCISDWTAGLNALTALR